MRSREMIVSVLIAYCLLPASIHAKLLNTKSSPFSVALDTLQKQINYKFERMDLLRRAMTHSSFSQENNKALSILGETVIDTSVALSSLTTDIDISAKTLNRRIADISKVGSSCALDGLQLGLQKIVRVSRNTNSTSPQLLCGAFRAIFGAIAVDKGSADEAGKVFSNVHGGGSCCYVSI